MGLAGPVTGDAEEDGGVATEDGGEASAAGLSRPRVKYLSIFFFSRGSRCFPLSLFMCVWVSKNNCYYWFGLVYFYYFFGVLFLLDAV